MTNEPLQPDAASAKLSVLAISYGRDVFDVESRNHQRLKFYAEALQRYEMVVFTRAHESYQTVRDGRLCVHPTRSWFRITSMLGSVWTGYRVLRKYPHEQWVITSQDPFDTGLVAYLLHRLTGHPFHIQLHADAYGPEWVKDSRLNPYRQRLGQWLMRRVRAVRVVSERIKQSLCALGISPEKITVLPIRADLQSFVAAPPDQSFRSQFDPDEIIVLAVSRLEVEKNLSMLLHAFAIAHIELPQLRLVIVGKGRAESMLRAEAEQLSLTRSVTWLPWSHNVAGYMAAADIYALPSRHEGWGMVLAEAMATGTPAVTTAVGCVEELFLGGVHGVVVPVGDEAAFASGLVRLGVSPTLRTKCGTEGRLRIQSEQETAESFRERIIATWTAVY